MSVAPQNHHPSVERCKTFPGPLDLPKNDEIYELAEGCPRFNGVSLRNELKHELGIQDTG